MDYEKKYKEALERARCYYTGANGNENMITMTTTIFPELAESEDERIRKWIIAYLENRVMNTSITDEKDNCLDAIRWLEKQGETWKPSEEQMAALELAVNDWYGDGVAIIDSLYNDLKKLKG